MIREAPCFPMDSLGKRMDNLTMANTDPSSPISLENALFIRESGHFFDMPEHFMFREDPKDFLVWLVIGGKGFVNEKGVKYEVSAGDLVTVLPHVRHSYGSDLKDPWSVLWAHFDGVLAPEYAGNLRRQDASTPRTMGWPGSRSSEPPESSPDGRGAMEKNTSHKIPGARDASTPATRRIIDKIARNAAERHASGPVVHIGVDPLIRDRFIDLILLREIGAHGADLRCRGELHALLSLLGQRVRRSQEADHPPSALDATAVETFIHQHLGDAIALDDLAGKFHLSVTHFSRLFRQRYRVSPMQYVTQARMGRACSMLRETRVKISQVGLAVGYEDPYYFSRIFRKTVGVSPQAFRRGDQKYEAFGRFVYTK